MTKKRQNKEERSGLPAIREPLEGIMSLREAMDRLFDESFWWPFGMLESREIRDRERGLTFFPRVDISEKGNEVRIKADIPGINPDKVNIEVNEDSLSISGSTEKSEEEKGENYYRLERQSGAFSREIVLPTKIDPNSVEAKAKNGTLFITLKKQPSEEKRKVQVKVE